MDTLINKSKRAEVNILYLNNDNKGHHCGYCDKQDTSCSFGFSTPKYSAELYDEMMLSGWRRCGDYVYKPNLAISCCKLYTCRLNVEQFKINKKQRQVMRRFRKYISGEYEEEKQDTEKIKDTNQKKPNAKNNDSFQKNLEVTLNEFVNSKSYLSQFPGSSCNCLFTDEFHKKLSLRRNQLKDEKIFGNYSSNVFMIIVNYLKKECRPEEKQDLFGKLFQIFELFCKNSTKNHTKVYKNSLSSTGHLNFMIVDNRLHQSFVDTFTKEQDENKKVQKEADAETKLKNKNVYTFGYYDELITDPPVNQIKHRYTVELSSNIQADQEKFLVYNKYQTTIHKDPENKNSIKGYNSSWGQTNFQDKIKIPVPNNLKNKGIYPEYYGTYNFIHRLDGKIFAVGVWDLLPTSLSSVYLYYDTDYSFLEPGVFTAIKEIEYVQSFNKLISNQFKYYVMGFYCDTCQKMRYKGEYSPTEILDPLTSNFVFLDNVKEKLKEKTLSILSKDPKKTNTYTDQEATNILNSISIVFRQKKINLVQFILQCVTKQYQEEIINTAKRFIILLGKTYIKYFDFKVEFS